MLSTVVRDFKPYQQRNSSISLPIGHRRFYNYRSKFIFFSKILFNFFFLGRGFTGTSSRLLLSFVRVPLLELGRKNPASTSLLIYQGFMQFGWKINDSHITQFFVMGWRLPLSYNTLFSSLIRVGNAKPPWVPLSQRFRLFSFLSLILDNFATQLLKCLITVALSGQKNFMIQVQLYYKIVIIVPLW